MTRRPTTSISATKAATLASVTPSTPQMPRLAGRAKDLDAAVGVRRSVPPSTPASAGSSTSASTIARSSTISQPTAMRPRSVSIMRRSCSARSSTTVVATDSARPKTRPAPIDQPSAQASAAPSTVAKAICTTAPGTAMARTDSRSFSEKCRPTPNISRMTPISASSSARRLVGDEAGRVRARPGRRRPDSRPAAGCGSGWRARRR